MNTIIHLCYVEDIRRMLAVFIPFLHLTIQLLKAWKQMQGALLWIPPDGPSRDTHELAGVGLRVLRV